MDIQEEIKSLCEQILGEPRRDFPGSGGWFEYNCPSCADENFGTPDEKYNLAVNYEIGSENGMFMHCWKCGFAGPLSRLFKVYGTADQYSKYKKLIADFKESHLYEIQSGSITVNEDFYEKKEVKLPNGISDVFDGSESANMALDYLHKRGVDDYLIRKHNIMYVGNIFGNPYRNMVVIPSYDTFGELNYFSGRDFTGKTEYNKKNYDTPKTEIVFNEYLINWYEPVTLVEGPFDHIVTPNSIPLLGKHISPEYLAYRTITEKAKHTVNIMLDSDAIENAYSNYITLNNSSLMGRVRLVRCPDGYDPSDVYRVYGKKGMLNLLSTASKMSDYSIAVLSSKTKTKKYGKRAYN